jgi:hypothetical protein
MAADEAFAFRPRLLLLSEVGAVHGNAAVRAFLHLQRQSYSAFKLKGKVTAGVALC